MVAGIVDGFRRHRLLVYSSAMAYQIVASVIPFACFTLGLMGLLQLESLWRDDIAPEIQSDVSGAAYTLLDDTVSNVLERRQTFWVTAGLALAIYEVSGAVRVVMHALDAIYEAEREPGWRALMVRSTWLGAAVLVLVLAAAAVLALGPLVIGSGVLSLIARLPLAAALLFLTVGLLVRYASATPQPLPWVSFGAGLVVAAWLVAAGAYTVYVTQLSSYESVFGSLAAVFAFVVFIYISTTVFVVGLLVDANVRRQARRR